MPISLTVKKIDGKSGQVYYPLQINTIPKPVPKAGEILVKLSAAALNHRDFFIRQHLYPGISFDHPLLADGYGTVIELGPNPSSTASSLLGKNVLLTTTRGWESDPSGPEDPSAYSVIGGAARYDAGTAQEFIVVPEDEVVEAPGHLSAVEGAALPLVGVTAWRALVTKCFNGDVGAVKGKNVLVTGIGGGVALQTLQFAVEMGAHVFVTSSSLEKIEKAKKMGARGGVNYRDGDWEKQLLGLLPKERKFLDCVVDGAGGDIVSRSCKVLKNGGIISCYGMTLGPKMDWVAMGFLKNIELRGTAMGSKKEFREMIQFVGEKKIRPVVSRVVKGLDNVEGIDGLFEDMRAGKQFGKLVILIEGESGDSSPKL
ncbi:alcohol dehydrogenase [Rhypophila decipiens]